MEHAFKQLEVHVLRTPAPSINLAPPLAPIALQQMEHNLLMDFPTSSSIPNAMETGAAVLPEDH